MGRPTKQRDILAATTQQARLERLIGRVEAAQRRDVKPPRLTAAYLVALIGEEAALHLMEHYPRSTMPSPLAYLVAQRNKAVVRQWLEGWTVQDLALRFKLSVKTIRLLLAAYRKGRAAGAQAPSEKPPKPALGIEPLVG